MIQKGKFIILEGADGAGTTTQALRLKKAIEKKFPEERCLVGHTPSEQRIGRFVRSLIVEFDVKDWRVMSSLFYADMVDYTENRIIPAILNGYNFICDRYYPSTLIYQSSHEEPFEHDEAIVRMRYMYDEMMGEHMSPADLVYGYPLLSPDASILLDLDRKTLLKRVEARGVSKDAYEGDAQRGRLVALYRAWFKSDFDISNKYILDGEQEMDSITSQCLEIFEETKA